MQKTLDTKLARILADPSVGDFILADAKDADMALAIGAPGRSPEAHSGELRYRSLAEFRDLFTAAGLRLTRVLSTASPNSILEGTLA